MDRRTNIYKFQYSIILLLLLYVLSPVLFTSCDDGGASSKFGIEYGSVAVSIRVSDDPAPYSDEYLNRYAMDVDPSCRVRVEIMDSSRSVIASGGPWSWSAGSGTVTGVPVGSDRIIGVKINDPSDTTQLYQGEVSGITVTSGANDLTDSPIFVYSTGDCADFSGYWYVTNIGTSYDDYCYGEHTIYNYSTISQDGCNATIDVEEFPGTSDGRVVGNTLYIDGQVSFTEGYEVTTYSNWTLVISGDSLTGSASWTYVDNYWGEYCTGTSEFIGSRQ